MKAKDIILTLGEKKMRLGNLSNNQKCALIVRLLQERNTLKKQLEESGTAKIG